MLIYSIVITYNGVKWVEKCIGSLVHSELQTKILVIDNASTDGTPDLIRQLYPQVEVIEPGKNLGFGKANNIGLKLAIEANSDFAFLLNQDAWIEPNTIELLIQTQQDNPDYWILSPMQMDGSKEAIELGFNVYLNKNKCKVECEVVQEVDFVNAAMWLLPKQCFETIGGFDPLFPHYGEDNDYVHRVHYWNKKVGVYLNAVGYHDRLKVNNTLISRNVYRTSLIIISQLKNITHSLAYNEFLSIYELFRKCLKYIIKMDYLSIKTYVKSYNIALMQLDCINKQRKKSYESGAFLTNDAD